MFKALKDARRRSVETLLGAIGTTERTSDPDFELFSGRFTKMMDDMCESGKAISDVLDQQKMLTTQSLELANVMSQVYSSNSENPWPKDVNEMTQLQAATSYKEAWEEIHTQIRSAIQAVQNDHGLEPVRACYTQLRPEYDSAVKTRAEAVMDYDSYRRRLKNLKEKQALNRQQGKDVGNAAADMKTEIERYESKETASKTSYEDQNEKLKAKIGQAKSMHDALMDDFIITAIVTQAEMFSRAAEKLQEVVNLLPQDKVIKCKAQIETMLDPSNPRRRPSIMPIPASATSSQPSAVAAPKVPSSPMQAVPFSSSSSAATTSYSAPSSPVQATAGNPFGDSEEKPATVFAGAATPTKSAAQFVVALYDHVADADDELDFSVGDKVEVVEQGDGGWWTGRCHGKIGLFPVNYVDASTLQ